LKKIMSIILVLALICSLCACSESEEGAKKEKEFVIILENTTKDMLRGASVTLSLGDEVFASMGMQNADGSLLGEDTLYFHVLASDFPEGAKLSDFSASFTITDAEGNEEWLQTVQFTPEWGEAYAYRLFHEDGYQLFPAELTETMRELLSSSEMK